MKVLKNAILTAGIAALGFQAQAQFTVVPENDPNFKLKFIGRTNFDAGTYLNRNDKGTYKNGNDEVDNAILINDTRLGFVGTKDKWEGKVEVCYTNGAISFRDVTLKYSFNEHNKVTFGNQFMPYGIKLTGINYKFTEDPSVDYTFCPSRKVGVNYLYTTDGLNISTGLYSNGNVDKKAYNQGFNAGLQLIWRPVYNETTVFHIGGAFLYTDKGSSENPSFKGVVPASIEATTLIQTGELEAPNYERYEFQALFIKEKWLLEAHFMGASVNTEKRSNFSGVWGQVSYQIIGDQQKYNKVTGLPITSAPGTLEVLGRVDYLNLDNFGNQTDFELGLNYIINKHFNVKFNYVVATGKDRPNITEDRTLNLIQTRLQFSF